MKVRVLDQIVAAQQSSNTILVNSEAGQFVADVGEETIKNFTLSERNLLVTTTGRTFVFSLANLSSKPSLSMGFPCEDIQIVRNDLVLLIYSHRIDISNLSGVVSSQVLLPEDGPKIEKVNVHGQCITLRLSENSLSVYELSSNAMKLLTNCSLMQSDAKIIDFSVNSTATKMCILTDFESNRSIALVDLSKDKIVTIPLENCQVQAAVWDATDHRYLIVDAKVHEKGLGPENHVLVFCVTENGQAIVLEDYKKTEDMEDLVHSNIPYQTFKKSSSPSLTMQFVTPAFSSVQELDTKALKLLRDFGYFCATNQVPGAMRCVQGFREKSMYRNAIRICIRFLLDAVAMYCFGQMGYMHAVRELRKIPSSQKSLKAAVCAQFLGDTELAEQILRNDGLFLELNELLQRSGRWTEAIQVAEEHDRIHLSNTLYKYGCHLRESNDIAGAIASLEKSGTSGRLMIPRILIEAGKDLEKYLKEILRWSAQYYESLGNVGKAVALYNRTNDVLSLVRIYCRLGDVENAKSIASEGKTDQRAACCFHLAQFFEKEKLVSLCLCKIPDAIVYYEQAKCYHQAIRLSKQHDITANLVRLALQSDTQGMIDVANYFEGKGDNEKAIQLLFKAGKHSRAIELAFKANRLDILGEVVVDMESSLSPEVLKKCVSYFAANGDYDRMVHLQFKLGDYKEALKNALEHSVVLNESMLDNLQSENKDLIMTVADICMHQKQYVLASKKYVQIGERVKALKALMCTGDFEKVVFFTNVTGPKQKEIYVLAANYLQTIAWQEKGLHQQIVNFYTRAKAFSSLGAFYEHCGEIEVEDYGNYEKANAALRQALSCFEKEAKTVEIERIEKKISYFNKYLKCEAQESETLCKELQDDVLAMSFGVKKEDVYALMFKINYKKDDYARAYEVYRKMCAEGYSVNLLDPDHLNVVLKANGKELMDEDVVEDIPYSPKH